MRKATLTILILTAIIGAATAVYFYMTKNTTQAESTGITYKALTNNPVETKVDKPIEYSGWIAWWNDGGAEDSAIESMKNNPTTFTRVMPMWFRVENNGALNPIEGAARKQEIEQLALSQHVEIWPTITNDFDPQPVSDLLDDVDKQTKVIDYLVFTAVSNGYKGWDIDWEELFVGDKGGFNDFVENLATKLHEKGLKLSVTVQAKTGTKIDAPSSDAQDWKILSAFADQMIIMAYDYHNSASEPGPITPMDLYEKTLDIAVSQIPLDKLIMGLPTYGYDWVGTKGTSIQYADAIKMAKDLNLDFTRDPLSGELTDTYSSGGQKHTVWYEDYESTKAKIDLARSKGVYRFAFWRLGGEDERIWDLYKTAGL
jgi:spore germination protein